MKGPRLTSTWGGGTFVLILGVHRLATPAASPTVLTGIDLVLGAAWFAVLGIMIPSLTNQST